MVSYIYTKTSSKFWIYTPHNILLKIKETNYWVECQIQIFIWPSKLCLGNTFTSWTHQGYCFLSNKKYPSFLVFTSCHNFRLILFSRLWFGKFSFKFLEILIDLIKLISSSVRKRLWYFPRLYQENFNYWIHYKHYLFHLYCLIFHKHLKVIHIHSGHDLILKKKANNISPQNVLIKLLHFLHSLTDFSNLHLSIYFSICFHTK